MTKAWLAQVALALLLAGCGQSNPDPEEEAPDNDDNVAQNQETADGAPGFRQLHESLMQGTCTSSACHGGERGIAGLTLTDPDQAYDLLVDTVPVNGPARDDGLMRVSPGDPESSLLLLKLRDDQVSLTERGYGAKMPLSLGQELGPDGAEAFEAWIDAGAPMDGDDVDLEWLDTGEEESEYVECDTTDEQGMRDCFAPPQEAEGETRRFYSPPITVPPQSEIIYCTYLDEDIPEELLVEATRGQQMSGGHHSALFMANVPSDDFEPRDCDDLDMTNFRFIAGAGGGGGQDTDMPDGTALRIPEGSQIVLQSHYINVTDEEVVVMDAVDIEMTTKSDPVIADAFAMIHDGFDVGPGEEQTQVKECRLDEDLDIYMLLGHTHDFGVLFTMEHVKSDGTTEELYHATDGPLLRDNPEIKMYDPPLKIAAGESLRMTCKWDNTTQHNLVWPEEMCVALMYYGPGDGWLTCGVDDETPRGGGDVQGCVAEDSTGNEFGVGEFCETNADCDGDASACLAIFDPAANFCSIMQCEDDAECGESATCVMQSLGSACVPDMCLD